MSGFELVYYDRSTIPISRQRWGELQADPSYRVIEQTVILDAADPTVGFDVSTVWLGINHNFLRSGSTPIIFETMVFPAGGAEVERDGLNNTEEWNASELDSQRYCFENEAREGHALFVVEYSLKVTDAIVMDRAFFDQEGKSE